MENTERIGRALVAIQHHLRNLRHRLSRKAGLNFTEFDLLATLHYHQRPMSVKELSKELFLCSQAVTKISKNLSQQGLIQSYKSETDKRVTYLTPTGQGTELAAEEQNIHMLWLSRSLSHNRDKTEPLDKGLSDIERQGAGYLSEHFSVWSNPAEMAVKQEVA